MKVNESSWNSTSDFHITHTDKIQVVILTAAFFCCCISFGTNCLTIIVSTRSKQFPFLRTLAFADALFALTYLIGAPYRISLLLDGSYRSLVPNWKCFNTPWVWTYDIGNFWPATITLFMRLERVSAQIWPTWYKENWTRFQRKLLKALRIVLLLFLAPSIIAASIGSINKLAVQKQMTWSQCTGYFGSKYHMFSNLYAVVCSIVPILFGIMFSSLGEKERLNWVSMDTRFTAQQSTLNRASQMVVFTNIFLVTIPNICRALERVKLLNIGEHRRALTTMTITNGAINFFIYWYYIPEFKIAIRKYMCRKNRVGIDSLTDHCVHDIAIAGVSRF